MKDIYIVAAKRTPFGRYHGLWAEKNAIDLGELALRETLTKYGSANCSKNGYESQKQQRYN